MIGTESYLGPATVVKAEGRSGHAHVRLPGGAAWARLAFTLPYRPSEGDELLVIRQEADAVYAIGVLTRAGGEVSIEAEGRIRLKSGDAIEIEAPGVTVRAGRLELAARRVIQRFQDAYLWLTGLFQLKSRRLRAVADEGLLVKSGRTHLKSEGDFSIDGRTIHLG